MPAIELNNVSVTFPVYSAGSRSLKNAMIAATTGGRIGNQANHVVIQALDQVSLSFEHGDRVALIGHNGAGKTTLLRVLAGIYEPNVGDVRIEGTVTPMFDISLGIDPDFTGYENIMLRGLYLGLSKSEIMARVDEIAEFTELGSFLELPVRTYSLGMQARLAFTMSTCIDPDILLLDEGIGAGDAAFLDKANERLNAFVGKAGILILASHSPQLIGKFCNKAVLMEHGHVLATGALDDVMKTYQGQSAAAATVSTAPVTLKASSESCLLDDRALAQIIRNTPLVSIDLIVRNAEGKILVGLRENEPAKGTYFVPGGRIRKDETIADALARIAKAEIGLNAAIGDARFRGVFEHPYSTNRYGEEGYGTHYVVLAYDLNASEATLKLPTAQHSAFRWMDEAALMAAPNVHPHTKAFFTA